MPFLTALGLDLGIFLRYSLTASAAAAPSASCLEQMTGAGSFELFADIDANGEGLIMIRYHLRRELYRR